MKALLLPGAILLAFGANTMFAASVCPAPYAGSVGGEGVNPGYITNTQISGSQATGTVMNNTGCNVLITFGPLGVVTTTFPNVAVSYDAGLDDNLIGIVNNSGASLARSPFPVQPMPSLVLKLTASAALRRAAKPQRPLAIPLWAAETHAAIAPTLRVMAAPILWLPRLTSMIWSAR